MTLQELLKPPHLALERLIFRPLNVRIRGKFAVHYAFHGHLFGDYFLNQLFHDHWHFPDNLDLLDHLPRNLDWLDPMNCNGLLDDHLHLLDPLLDERLHHCHLDGNLLDHLTRISGPGQDTG